MTREEAIAYFHHRKVFCEDHLKICPKDSIAHKEKEVCDVAIKALEFIDKMHKLKTDYNNYKISKDERIKAEVELFKEVGI